MSKRNITFTFLSPWHMGSGFGEGAHIDSLPVKTAGGLPYIPGRSVKGLFRESVQSAEECGWLKAGTTATLFGSRDGKISRYETTPGLLRFSSATFGDAMESWALESDDDGKRMNAAAVQQLFISLAATRIEDDGIAGDKTLRKIEVALPVDLTAVVEADTDDEEWVEALGMAASLIRQAGTHRHRGLGRVSVAIKEVNL
jgi:CRISPR/Cas system CSM-associated protein Csm3 (group 7 of RAMP superfamily)